MRRLRNHFRVLAAALLVVSALRAGVEYTVPPGTPVAPNQLLVRFSSGTSIASVGAALLPGSSAQPISGLPDVYLVRLPSGSNPSFSSQLSKLSTVQYVEPNRIRTFSLQSPNDPSLPSQYALTNIQAQQAWQLLPNTFLTSSSALALAGRIKVAVLDTGADCTHPDFVNAGGNSADAAQGGQILFASSQAFVATTISPPVCSWRDDQGHGTHTSGTIAAATNNSTGVSSLGFPLELIEFKVLDNTGSGTDADVANAIIAAANAGANVISMSLGGGGYSPTIQDAVNYAWQRNCVVVAAKGNSNSSQLFFPSDANYVVGVGATDGNDLRASFSNYGFGVDVAAPGLSVLSTYFNQSYTTMSGTSMATPHVAALAGLIEMASPNLAAMAVIQRIQQSADSSYANGGWDGATTTSTSGLGYGRINAWRAISVGNLRSASVGGIVGQVVDNSGAPVPIATVSVPGQSVVTDNPPLDQLNSTGLFRLSNLAAGATYTVTTTASGYSTSTIKVAVVGGADTNVTIVLGGTTGEFHGVVSDGGVPVAGAVVQAISQGLIKSNAVTDSGGNYSTTLPPGTYDLRASVMYGVTTTVASNLVGANGSVLVNIAMAKMGNVFGTVRDSNNNAVANAQISISNSSFTAGAVTNGSGGYTTIGIPAGTYTVAATPPGGSTTSVTGVAVTNDHATQQDFGPNVTSITVATSPAGLSISVDGVGYTAPQSFFWTPGSSHTIAVITNPQNGTAGTRYAWASWSDSLAVSHGITTPSSATTYTANFTTQYLLTLAASPAAGGTLAANPSSSDGYYNSGTAVQVTATANSGYQFANFSGDLSGSTNPQSVTLSAPRSVTGNFNVNTTVTTNPVGLTITVDGQNFASPQTFAWTQGSSHTIAIAVNPQSGVAGTRFAWASWSDALAISHSVTIGSTPATYTANFTTQYLLTTSASPAAGGSLAANPASGDGYYNSGTSVQLTATANSGYQFANYSGDLIGSGNPQSVTMSAPRSVTGSFSPVTGVTVATNPAALAITVDGVAYTAPQNFNWIVGSNHTIAVASTQTATGTKYSWTSWSDSGAISHSVTAPGSATTYTANYSTQYLLTLAASPGAGGSLAANPTSADGYYASGTSVQVTATANAGYQFANYSGDLAGATNPQSVTLSAPRSVTGNFSAVTSVTVTTNPAGLGVTVDGTSLTAPQTFNWVVGSNHTIAVASPQTATGTKYTWSSWSDSGAISHSVTTPGFATTYTANFTTQYLLTLAAAPSGGGTITASPSSSDGYYASGTSVQVTAAANSGYQFASFSGDLTGTTNPQSVTLSAPRTVTGSFNVSTTVSTFPAGLSISVDGQSYTAPHTFYWVQGSNHTVAIASSTQNGPAGTRYVWSNWSDSGTISHTVTAGSTPTTYNANFTTQYLLTLAVSPSGGGTLTASPTANGNYYDSGTAVQITAAASSGYQFGGFSGDLTGSTNPQTTSMSAPRSVTGTFTPFTTVTTSPAGLTISVDGQSVTAPATFGWTPGSNHTIAIAINPQSGPAGTRYVWANWNDSGLISHSVTAGSSPATYTANFTTQYLLTLASSPGAGGTLTANPSGSYFDSGASVQVTAAASSGYQFVNFSGDLAGTANPQSVSMSAPRSVTGNFSPVSGVTVATSPAGLGITVDGQNFTAPQTFNWVVGSGHTVAVSSPQTGSGTRYVWGTWSDGGAISHSVTVPASAATYTANFTTQYLLTMAASPSAGGSLTANPSSADGYYASGTPVQVSAAASANYQFANFSGDLIGTASPQTVTMSAPRSVTGNFNVKNTVATAPAGQTISVDGQSYTAPQTFYWTQGSSHTIAIATNPQSAAAGTQYAWTGWSDNGAISHPVIASSSASTYTANFKTQYLLTLVASPAAAGALTANPSAAYYDSGTSVQVTASANSGYQFASFSGDLSGATNPQSVTMSAPRTVTGNFNVNTTVTSSPAGLSVNVDGQNYATPFTFTWTQGSSHTIAVATNPQYGLAGTRYVWSSWSDSGGISHSVTAGAAPATYTANFATQYLLTKSASPAAGGSVTANPASSDGYYASGTSVQVTATANSGYVFSNFSGDLTGSANPQTVTLSAPRTVTASFSAMSGITIATSPAGLGISVDGTSYTAPQNFNWVVGSNHTIAVSSPQTATGTRYVWSSWSDGGAVSHTIAAPASAATYTANFNTQYLLTLAASPLGGGALAANPSSSDAYYASGTSVQVAATVGSGYQFSNFTGDLTGSTNPQSVTMSAPRSVTGVFTSVGQITSQVDHTNIYYGYSGSVVTSPQTVRITVPAGVAWTASSNQANITVSPSSGTGSGNIQITVTPGSSGIVTVSAGPGGLPQQIQVTVSSVPAGLPFGSFDTPVNNSTGIAGAVAVTGWALDRIEVTKVDIWREPVGNEIGQSNGLIYIGDAVFVAGSRPDVESAYPAIPLNYRAGWGYLLLTNFLPATGSGAAGNGTYKLHAIAHGKSGSLLDLGTRSITVDNAHASRPFGTIDTPGQGGSASGSAYINFGWALTQNPYVIPFDGSTITVTVDGVPLGHPTYNQYRSDIANAFPGLANSNGAVGYFFIDTTKLTSGIHSIGWVVYDNAGRGDGIGSRLFTVTSGTSGGAAQLEAVQPTSAVKLRQGPAARNRTARTVKPDARGVHSVTLTQKGTMELELGAVSGNLLVNGERRALPIGSTLQGGVFYWQPPAGFLGDYQFSFQRSNGKEVRVKVSVEPDFPTMLQ